MPTTAGIVQVEARSPQVSLDLSCMGKDRGRELSPAVWWDALAEAESVRLEPGVLRWDVFVPSRGLQPLQCVHCLQQC